MKIDYLIKKYKLNTIKDLNLTLFYSFCSYFNYFFTYAFLITVIITDGAFSWYLAVLLLHAAATTSLKKNQHKKAIFGFIEIGLVFTHYLKLAKLIRKTS